MCHECSEPHVRGGRSSGGRAGPLLTGRLAVESQAPPVCMANVLGEDTNPMLLTDAFIRVWMCMNVRYLAIKLRSEWV